MTLEEQLNQDYISAMKERDSARVETLRMLKSAIKNEAIKVSGLDATLQDDQVISVLNREAKQRRDAIEQYEAAGRSELADKEKSELALIETYLPQAMDESALQQIIDEVLTETGATQKSDMGKVMGALKAKIANPADVAKAAALVSQKLT